MDTAVVQKVDIAITIISLRLWYCVFVFQCERVAIQYHGEVGHSLSP